MYHQFSRRFASLARRLSEKIHIVVVRNRKKQSKKVSDLPNDKLISFYREMYLIRQFEINCGKNYTYKHIRGFLHLYSGQEAVAVGSIKALDEGDYITTHYRDHGHALARGISPNRIMAELFGKKQGTSSGKGGSMHIFDVSRNFMGGHAIVGAQIPVAVGIGLSLKHQKKPNVSVCFLGDGSTANGVYHESLNLAGLWELPVVFILENNGYGMGTALDRARVSENGSLSTHIEGMYGIPSYTVDGMDVLAVHDLTSRVLASARDTHRPAFIEAYTYRFEGHSLADGQLYRTKGDIAPWLEKDPLVSYPAWLIDQNIVTASDIDTIKREVDQVIDDAESYALDADEPDLDELFDDIYA